MPLKIVILSVDLTEEISEPVEKVFNQELISFGRNKRANDVILNRPEISSRHMRIRYDNKEDKIFVTDLGSLNGTTIEGKLLEPNVETELKEGQRIGVGTYIVKPVVVEDSNTLVSAYSLRSFSGFSGSITSSKSDSSKSDASKSYSSRSDASKSDKSFVAAEPEESSQVENFSIPKIHSVDQEAIINNDSFDDEIDEGINPPEDEGFDAVEEEVNVEEKEEHDEDDGFLKYLAMVGEDSNEGSANEESAINEMDINKKDYDIFAEEEQAPDQEEQSYHVRDVIADDCCEINFDAFKVGNLSGRVTHKGEPLPFVTIDAGEFGLCQTDENGKFVFTDVEEGATYSLSASKEKYLFTSDNSSGVVSDNESVEFIATELFRIVGRVCKFDGVGLEGVDVDIAGVGQTKSDFNGDFEFDDVPEGTAYAVNFSKDRYVFNCDKDSGVITQDLSIKVNATKLLKISGVVKNKGVPIEGVKVDAGDFGVVYTDENGAYSFDNIPEGSEYELTLSKAGYKFGKNK